MTRFIHDQFAKDYLESLLSPYGEVLAPRRVVSEVREIDVWFAPTQKVEEIFSLGLLGRMAATSSIFEPFRNPATEDEICFCLLKLLLVRGQWQREVNRQNTASAHRANPKLWVLTPTASRTVLSRLGASTKPSWPPGVYFMAASLRTAIVAIHQLPATPDTLWLRLLGRGRVQKRAIDSLELLPANDPIRSNTLKLLYNLQKNLAFKQGVDEEDRELIMRLAPLYEQDREQAFREGERQGLQQGLQQERRLSIENLLRSRFGSFDEKLAAIVEPLLALSPEEFVPLLLQLSKEELLERFAQAS